MGQMDKAVNSESGNTSAEHRESMIPLASQTHKKPFSKTKSKQKSIITCWNQSDRALLQNMFYPVIKHGVVIILSFILLQLLHLMTHFHKCRDKNT